MMKVMLELSKEEVEDIIREWIEGTHSLKVKTGPRLNTTGVLEASFTWKDNGEGISVLCVQRKETDNKQGSSFMMDDE